MMNLLLLYKWVLLAGSLMAGVLAFWGAQLAARERVMQTLCIAQGASLGNLVALGIIGGAGLEWPFSLLPSVAAPMVGAFCLWFTEKLGRRVASGASAFTVLFCLLLAACHLTTSLFAGLESHFSQAYFGDLATVSNSTAILSAFVAVVLGSIYWKLRLSITGRSFDRTVLKRDNASSFFVDSTGLLLVTFAVQYLGFLFTTACLFFPTVILNLFPRPGLNRHLRRCILSAGLSAPIGFAISLTWTRLPTVPSIVIVLTLVTTLFAVLEKLRVKDSTKYVIPSREFSVGSESV